MKGFMWWGVNKEVKILQQQVKLYALTVAKLEEQCANNNIRLLRLEMYRREK